MPDADLSAQTLNIHYRNDEEHAYEKNFALVQDMASSSSSSASSLLRAGHGIYHSCCNLRVTIHHHPDISSCRRRLLWLARIYSSAIPLIRAGIAFPLPNLTQVELPRSITPST